GRPLPDLAAFIACCEDSGLDGVGIHDHPSSGRDAYLALALAAQATRRLRLFPAMSSPLGRHPLVVLASLAHSLEEIAPRSRSAPLQPTICGLIRGPYAVRDLRRSVPARPSGDGYFSPFAWLAVDGHRQSHEGFLSRVRQLRELDVTHVLITHGQ